MKKVCSVLVACGALLSAEAVILAGGDGTQNTTAPSGGQGWEYVGRITSANNAPSGVTYISNNWFITAYHIKHYDNPTGVLLGGAAHAIDPNSWKRLTNSVGENADLVMFRVVGSTINLPGLTVRSSSTPNNADLTMIGNGRNRASGESHWDVDKSNINSWIWSEVSPPPPPDESGYKWASGSTKRWGTNTKDANSGLIDDGFGITDTFRCDFDNIGGSQAQGATYDSGGGVFYNNGGSWELAGIMIFTTGSAGQPGSTAVYGNRTYMADMQHYAAQISAISAGDDLDEDGIPDGWEFDQSGSTTGVDAGADQDADGFTGFDEWIADTDPTDFLSYLHLESYTNGTDLVFSSSTNRDYQVQYLTSLTNSPWLVELDWFSAIETQTVASVDASASNRFFRLRAKLP